MRARWVMLIAGGFLVLAIGAMFIRPRPQRLVVAVFSETNNPTVYAVHVGNPARRLYVFAAWTEYEASGAWKLVATHKHNATLKPSETHVFTLLKPERGKARVVVQYGRVEDAGWEHWRNAFRALAGLYPKPEKMYIDAP